MTEIVLTHDNIISTSPDKSMISLQTVVHDHMTQRVDHMSVITGDVQLNVNDVHVFLPINSGTGVEDAPNNSNLYVRQNNSWVVLNKAVFPDEEDSYLYATTDVLNAFRETALGLGLQNKNRYISITDLIEMGMVSRTGAGSAYLVPNIDIVSTGPLVTSTPPVPRNLTVIDGHGQIQLFWESAYEHYSNHSVTQVWRSAIPDINTAVPVAVIALGFQWTDKNTVLTTQYYYWIRFQNTLGTFGNFTSLYVRGTAKIPSATISESIPVDSITESMLSPAVIALLEKITSPIEILDGIVVPDLRAAALQLVNELRDLGEIVINNATASASAFTAEATVRTAALLTEAAARGTDISNTTTLIENTKESMASQLNAVTAAFGEVFDIFKVWHFISTVEGWTCVDGVPSVIEGSLLPAYSTNTQCISEAVLFDGGKYSVIQARIIEQGSPLWTGTLYFTTTIDTTYNETNKLIIGLPVLFGNSGIAEWKMEGVGTWDISIITGIKIIFSINTTITDHYKADWIRIGKIADQSSLAAIVEEQEVLTTAVEASASSTQTLAAQMRGNYTGSDLNQVTTGLIHASRQATATDIDALAQQMALLSAGATTQFDHAEIWYFDAGIEGWGGAATPTIVNSGWLRPGNHAASYAVSPVINIVGGTYPQIRARIKKFGSPIWEGAVNYATVANGSWDKYVTIPEPTFDNDIADVTWNIPTPWTIATVTQFSVRLSLIQDSTNYFEIDWFAVGRPAPGASSADLFTEQLARINADTALAGDITVANTAIAGKASQSSVDSLTSRITTSEGTLTVQGNKLTSLDSKIGVNSILPNPYFSPWDNGQYYPDDWTGWNNNGVSKHTGAYAYSGGAAVQFITDAVSNSGFDVTVSNQSNVEYIDLQICFTLVSGSLSGVGILFDWNNTVGGIYRDTLALNSLYVAADIYGKKIVCNARVKRPFSFTGIFSSYTCYVMGNYASGLGALAVKTIVFDSVVATFADANANAIQALDTRVTSAEGSITSQSSSITSLSNSIVNLEKINWTRDYEVNNVTILPLLYRDGAALPTSIILNAGSHSEFVATGVTIWTGTVTKTIARFYYDGAAWQIEQLSSLGQTSNHPIFSIAAGVPAVHTLHATLYLVRVTMEDVRLAGGYGSANSSAISVLSSTVTSQGGAISSHAGAITVLQTDITDKAEQSSVDALTSRTTSAEGTLTTHGNKLTALDGQFGATSLLLNPNFAQWTNAGAGAYPDLWDGWSNTGLSQHTGAYAYSGGKAAQYITVINDNSGFVQSIYQNAEYLDFEITFTLLSGSLSGAGIHVQWYSSSGTWTADIALKDLFIPSEIYNKKIVCKARVKRPSGFTGTFTTINIFVMANYSGSLLGALSVKTIIFDTVFASVADASASAIQSLDTRVTSAEGSLTTQSSSITALRSTVNLSTNLLDNSTWVAGSTGSQGVTGQQGFWSSSHTVASESRIVTAGNTGVPAGPFGGSELLWECQDAGDNQGSGGYDVPLAPYNKISKHRGCVFATFVQHNGLVNGNIYHGFDWAGGICDMGGTTHPNPYVTSFPATAIAPDKWYLLYGVVHSRGSQAPDTTLSGVYDCTTGLKVIDGEEFRMTEAWDASDQLFRNYLFYSTDTAHKCWFARPMVMPLDVAKTPWQMMDQLSPSSASASAISALNTTIYTNVTGLVPKTTANADAITQLQVSLGGANAQAFTALNATVSAPSTGLVDQMSAQASALTQIAVRIPGGGNLAPNSDFRSNANGWYTFSDGTVSLPYLNHAGATYIPAGYNQIGCHTTAQTGSYQDIRAYYDSGTETISVEPGKRYCFSANTASHRISDQLMIIAWYTETGAYIAAHEVAATESNGGNLLDYWPRNHIFAIAPAGARKAGLIVRGYRQSGQNDPYLWICRPMFSEVHADTTVPPPYELSVAGAYAAIEEEATVRASETGTIMASKVLKLDVNGKVAGWGAMNTGVESIMEFAFDKVLFWAPGNTSLALTIAGGKVAIPGAHITDLSVNQITGDTANFVRLNVGTLVVDDIQGDVTVLAEISNVIPFSLGAGKNTIIGSITLSARTNNRPFLTRFLVKGTATFTSGGTHQMLTQFWTKNSPSLLQTHTLPNDADLTVISLPNTFSYLKYLPNGSDDPTPSDWSSITVGQICYLYNSDSTVACFTITSKTVVNQSVGLGTIQRGTIFGISNIQTFGDAFNWNGVGGNTLVANGVSLRRYSSLLYTSVAAPIVGTAYAAGSGITAYYTCLGYEEGAKLATNRQFYVSISSPVTGTHSSSKIHAAGER